MVFTYHGGLFTSIKTAGAVSERARAASLVVGVPTAIGALALVGATYVFTDLFNSVLAIICFALAIVFFLISNSTYTLTLMTCVAFVFVPIILAYQIWVYWTFRHRVSEKDLHY